MGARLGVSVKDGEGPPEVLRYFELAGRGIALVEAQEKPDSDFMVEFKMLDEQVRASLRGTG